MATEFLAGIKRASAQGDLIRDLPALIFYQDKAIAEGKFGEQQIGFPCVPQAVAECFAKSGKACEGVPASEMVKALEYFIVPQSMWPQGIAQSAVALRDQLDGIADRIMSQVKADFQAPPRSYSSDSEI